MNLKQTLVASLFVASTSVMAAGAQTGVVTLIEEPSEGYFLVTLSNAATGTRPGCATSANRFGVNATTTGGSKRYALILYAASLGKTVAFAGTNTCTVWSDTETIGVLTVNN
jgi:hypothetical protein